METSVKLFEKRRCHSRESGNPGFWSRVKRSFHSKSLDSRFRGNDNLRVLQSLILTLVLIVAHSAFAQALKPGEWRTYTSMRQVQALALSSDSIHAWAVTSGGAFRVNVRDVTEPIFALRTTDGLTENDLTAVASDNNGNVFFGGRTGGFDVLNESTGTVRQLGSDIRNSGYPIKTINSIAVSGDTIYLATGYGLSVFISGNPGYFGTTINHLGSFPLQDSIRQVVLAGGYIYAAMQEGLAYAPVASDLSNGNNWTTLPDSVPILALAVFNETIYAGTTRGLFALSADRQTYTTTGFPNTVSIDRLVTSSDSLFVLDGSGTVYSTHDLQHFAVQSPDSIVGSTVTAILPAPYIPLVLGSSANGVAFYSGDILHTNLFPEGPVTNYVFDLHFSSSTDRLYGVNLSDGFELFQPNDDSWQTYVSGVDVPNSNYQHVFYDSIRNVTWLSTHGDGLFRVKDLGSIAPVWTDINDQNGGLPITIKPHYIVAGAGALTASSAFMITTWAQGLNGLSITSDGTSFTNYRLALTSSDPGGLGQSFGCVTQDQDGNFWVGTERNITPSPYGVFWVRASDHAFGSIQGGSGSQLSSPVVNAILTDQDDGIWCGTEGGVQIISNPYAVDSDPNPQFFIRTVPLLTGQIVHTMAVDGVGNKWIGTENGIFVVSPDGSGSITQYTTGNSPLVDNIINAIAIDTKRGEAYAATPSGISRFSTIFKQGNPDYSTIRVYPNPVVQSSDYAPPIYIEGLVAGSTVKVFTLNGKLIATINGTTLGSTVVWSGRDDLGRQVPSGMYLVSATSPQSGGNGEAKVVIVRKP